VIPFYVFLEIEAMPRFGQDATIVCVECVRSLATMDEEFQVLVEYVEYKFLVKTIVGLEVSGRIKDNKKWMNSSTRRW
jgi:hypothetical protein